MDYSNPKIPEGINTSKKHPLKDFFLLSIGVLGSIALCAFLLALFAERLAVYIPFSMEQKLIPDIELNIEENPSPEIQQYLEKLANELLPFIELPEDMEININYIDEPIENAFASLAGHIEIFRGLIELLPHENSLAMVVAHEIAHIKHRDPVVALGRGVVVGLFLSAITGTNSDRFISSIISSTGNVTVLGFNRKQESHADELALRALASYYGHVNGADELFKVFLKLEKKYDSHTPEFFSTHPLSDKRIDEMKTLAEMNNWPTEGELTSLPNFISEMN